MSFLTSGRAVFSVTYVPAVTGLTASNPQETTVDLAWIGARSATSYSIVSTPATTTQTTSGTSYTFTGLSGGTSYTFTVTSVGAAGSGGSTTSSSVTTLDPTPGTVTNFVASNPQETTVDLVWDPALYATSYSIESSPPGTWTQTTSDTFITFIELTPNTEYTFTNTPTNATGTGPPTTSDPISTLLPLPGFGPAMATPTNVTQTTMDLSWFEYVPEYATSFNVYAYSVISGLIGFVNVPISSFSYTYTGLIANTEYYFAVAGVNVTGVGPEGAACPNTFTDQPLVAVGGMYSGTYNVMTSSDGGVIWTGQTSADVNTVWLGVAWSGTQFVAVGGYGSTYNVMTSPDGVLWTGQTPADVNTVWVGVTWSGTQFVAVGAGGVTFRVMTSPDGITWTGQTAGVDLNTQWYSVTWSGTQFVVVGTGFTYSVMTSPDGITWTGRTPADPFTTWNSVTWSGTQFVAVGGAGMTYNVMSSPDGIIWAGQMPPDPSTEWYSVTWSGTQFVAVGAFSSFYRVITSPDGITWTGQTEGVDSSTRWFSVTWTGTQFVAVGNSASDGGTYNAMTSPDGITWTGQTSADPATRWYGVA